jgi:hypothetical protein
MAGAAAERQETGLVNKINNAVRTNQKNPITVIAGKTKITGVVKAEKYSGRQSSGSEPYTDVIIHVKSGKKTKPVNLSMKGESAPSLAGGGLRGLELAVPGIAKRYMKSVYKHLTEKKHLNPGDKVPDVYGKISPNRKEKIVVGNAAMGGPIDYMYIGPMTVTGRYDKNKNELKVSGELTEAKAYAKSHDLYFRLRARREDQRFDPDAKENDGTPKVYGASPSRGDKSGRIVVTDKTPSNAIIVRFS